jgi:protein SCO1/2
MPLRLAAGAAAVLAAALPAIAGHGTSRPVVQETYTARPDPTYKAPDPATLGGSFAMTDHTGQAVTEETYHGKWLLMFFGFTGCREVCPLGLERMLQVMEKLGPEQEKIQPLFVDFAMDEPDLKGLAQFVSNFHPRLIGLAGTRAQTFDILRKFKVRREYGHDFYSRKETGPRIDHTTYLYLVDPAGKTRAYYYHSLSAEEMAAMIRKVMSS